VSGQVWPATTTPGVFGSWSKMMSISMLMLRVLKTKILTLLFRFPKVSGIGTV
jgi:hypothetical protein